MSRRPTSPALLFVPLGGVPSLISFPGDFLLVAYLLGVGRFFTVTAALDTGSSFEGMGASREAFYSALAEPALLLGLAAIVAQSHALSLSTMMAAVTPGVLASSAGSAFLLVAAAMLIVLLAENARIPVDDPNTHLELTMIHEVMVLDHSGPDLAMIHYAAALKLWVFGALLVGILVPVRSGWWIIDLAAGIGGNGNGRVIWHGGRLCDNVGLSSAQAPACATVASGHLHARGSGSGMGVPSSPPRPGSQPSV